MKRVALSACAPCVALSGCSANPESFWKAVVRIDCRTQKKCDEADFNDQYDDVADCRDDAHDICEPEEFADACEGYDSEEGRECLEALRERKRDCDTDTWPGDCEVSQFCGDDVDPVALGECLVRNHMDVPSYPRMLAGE